MRKCVLFVALGRSILGIVQDVLAYLKSQGWEVEHLVIVARDSDELKMAVALDTLPGLKAEINYVFVSKDGKESRNFAGTALAANLPQVFVLNGGTTPQTWWLIRNSTAGQETERMEEAAQHGGSMYKPREALPAVAVDVQRDSVEIMHNHRWPAKAF